MPQIPLFVSSAHETTQNDNFVVRFDEPLVIPEHAKNATIHIAHATLHVIGRYPKTLHVIGTNPIRYISSAVVSTVVRVYQWHSANSQ
eukprot:SAG11_NODE_4427_length_1899_cov_0.969444_3_plen_88_part_00